jgi:uncharacterized membrane protein (UPF0127 family)
MNRKNKVKIRVLKNEIVLAEECVVAESFFDRLKGLIGTKTFSTGQGLLLKPCNNIHMWFMSVSIDVIFGKEEIYNNQLVIMVSSFKENIKPWRIFPLGDMRASQTLELPVGTIQRCNIRKGDILCIN